MKDKAYPEGSRAEVYIVNESMTFCLMYLRDIETKFNRDGHIKMMKLKRGKIVINCQFLLKRLTHLGEKDLLNYLNKT